ATPGADSIRFNIGSSGSVQTFTPASALPVIDEAVTIDGTTQPGYSGTPLIELNGSLAPSDANGLTIISGGTTVRGLVINRFGGDAGISIQLGSGGNVVQGNYVGTDVTGTIARGNSNGIYTFDSSNDLIGGFAASARNLISGNAGHGVFIQGYSGAGTVVAGNYIGTDVSGNVDLGNAGSGVWINNESSTTVGGASSGSRNVISGNDGDGITVYAGNGAVIQGNFIGTNAAGTAALPNTHNGVFLSTSTDNLVGGTTAAARNVISGNGSAALDAGVVILGGDELGNT